MHEPQPSGTLAVARAAVLYAIRRRGASFEMKRSIQASMLLLAALVIGWDGLKAYQKYAAQPAAPKPAPASA